MRWVGLALGLAALSVVQEDAGVCGEGEGVREVQAVCPGVYMRRDGEAEGGEAIMAIYRIYFTETRKITVDVEADDLDEAERRASCRLDDERHPDVFQTEITLNYVVDDEGKSHRLGRNGKWT